MTLWFFDSRKVWFLIFSDAHCQIQRNWFSCVVSVFLRAKWLMGRTFVIIDAHWFVLATSGSSSCSITADLNSAGQKNPGTAREAMKHHELTVSCHPLPQNPFWSMLRVLELEDHPLRLKRATCSHCRSELCQSKPSPSRPQCLPVSSLGEHVGALPLTCGRIYEACAATSPCYTSANLASLFPARNETDGTIFSKTNNYNKYSKK